MKTLRLILVLTFQAIFIALGIVILSELAVMLFLGIIDQHQRLWG